MESAEKEGRMSSPHVDEEKRGKATVYKERKKKKEGTWNWTRKTHGKTPFSYRESSYTKTQYFGLGSD